MSSPACQAQKPDCITHRKGDNGIDSQLPDKISNLDGKSQALHVAPSLRTCEDPPPTHPANSKAKFSHRTPLNTAPQVPIPWCLEEAWGMKPICQSGPFQSPPCDPTPPPWPVISSVASLAWESGENLSTNGPEPSCLCCKTFL